MRFGTISEIFLTIKKLAILYSNTSLSIAKSSASIINEIHTMDLGLET